MTTKPRTIAIIQARMASRRLPGKVLKDIAGKPMLAHVVERTRRAEWVDEVVVATTVETSDDPVAALCTERGYPCVRGSMHDVLDRYYQAAKAYQAEIIVRITADCPVIDPGLIDAVLQLFVEADPPYDFIANRLPEGRTYPIGLDTEVCSMAALETAWHAAEAAHQREHVMPFLYDNRDRFRVKLVHHSEDLGHYRWTVDAPADLEALRAIFAYFEGREDFTWLEIVDLYRKHPALAAVNAAVEHKKFGESEIVLQDNIHNTLSQPVTRCPLCASTDRQPFDQRLFREVLVENVLCHNCGLVYQSQRMSAEEQDAFYETEYRQMYQGGAGPNPQDLAVQRARAAALTEFLQAQRLEITRHLDIGCSAGLLLDSVRLSFGSQPTGVEPGEAYRQYAQDQGLTVYASLEDLEAAENEPFDLVSMAHVLEHIPDPVGYLAHLRETMLSPSGRLLIEVPNLYTHDSFEVAHTVSFSPHTLRQTLAQAGYRVLDLVKHGQPRSDLVPLYLTVLAAPLANPQPGAVAPERRVARKRKWGLLRRRILTRLFPDAAWKKVS